MLRSSDKHWEKKTTKFDKHLFLLFSICLLSFNSPLQKFFFFCLVLLIKKSVDVISKFHAKKLYLSPFHKMPIFAKNYCPKPKYNIHSQYCGSVINGGKRASRNTCLAIVWQEIVFKMTQCNIKKRNIKYQSHLYFFLSNFHLTLQKTNKTSNFLSFTHSRIWWSSKI